jgi:hypothetical protein
MSIVNYACNQHPYVANPPGQYGHITPRPWVEVTAKYGGSTNRVWCLVDTGADDTILDLGTAAAFGVNHLTLPQVNITLANGVTLVAYGQLGNVFLDFAGAQVPPPGSPAGITILLGPVAVPLLGRSALLRQAGSLAGAGFEAGQWQHT